MFGLLILWAFSSCVLYAAVRFSGDVPNGRGTFSTAIVASAVLYIAGVAFKILPNFMHFMWPVVWLYALKSVYGFGWLRAVGVWLVLVVLAFVFGALVLFPLGLAGAAIGLVAL